MAGRPCPAVFPPHAGAAGFTVVEVLVTFVLFSLLVLLLFSGYGYVLLQRERFDGWLASHRTEALERSWFETAIEGLATPYEQEEPQPATAERFSGVSYSLPGQPLGRPLPFTLRVARGEPHRLLLESGADLLVLRESDAPLSLAYFDYEGNRLNRWPPEAALGESVALLPLAVIVREGDVSLWLKRPGGRVGQFVADGR